MSQGKLNTYTCQKCGQSIVTVDRDEGVTPFSLICRATPGCEGHSLSACYQNAQDLTPTHEWYAPPADEVFCAPAGMAEHASKGGLFLRRIGETELERKERIGSPPTLSSFIRRRRAMRRSLALTAAMMAMMPGVALPAAPLAAE